MEATAAVMALGKRPGRGELRLKSRTACLLTWIRSADGAAQRTQKGAEHALSARSRALRTRGATTACAKRAGQARPASLRHLSPPSSAIRRVDSRRVRRAPAAAKNGNQRVLHAPLTRHVQPQPDNRSAFALPHRDVDGARDVFPDFGIGPPGQVVSVEHSAVVPSADQGGEHGEAAPVREERGGLAHEEK